MKLNIKKIISVSFIIVLILFTNLRVNSEDINSSLTQDISQTALQNADQQQNNSPVPETTIAAINTSQNTVTQTTNDQRLINVPENNMANISESNTTEIPNLNMIEDNESYSNQSTADYIDNISIPNLNDSENFSTNQSQPDTEENNSLQINQTNTETMINNNSIENSRDADNSPYFYVPIDSAAETNETENTNYSDNESC